MRSFLVIPTVAVLACTGVEPARGASSRALSRTVARPSAPASEARVILAPSGRDPVAVRVEVARTAPERRRGLMYRRGLAPDAGMLFVYPDAAPRRFWMRHTSIPLDMIFVDRELRVLGVVDSARPDSDELLGVDGDAQFVLEVRAGFARAHGIVPGTPVRLDRLEEAGP
jgi:uncharacterized membrane protein (UPF0127 family)